MFYPSDDEIIAIASSFFFPAKQLYRPTTCDWVFVVPDGYQLKFNVKQIELLEGATLSVTTESEEPIEIKTAGSYKFGAGGNNVTINYKNNKAVTAIHGFGGYLVFEAIDNDINNDCHAYTDNGIFKFGNIDYYFGYSSGDVSLPKILELKRISRFNDPHFQKEKFELII